MVIGGQRVGRQAISGPCTTGELVIIDISMMFELSRKVKTSISDLDMC